MFSIVLRSSTSPFQRASLRSLIHLPGNRLGVPPPTGTPFTRSFGLLHSDSTTIPDAAMPDTEKLLKEVEEYRKEGGNRQSSLTTADTLIPSTRQDSSTASPNPLITPSSKSVCRNCAHCKSHK
ncbi:hypothetical protein M422DRAFT_31728 [Sphaerobolus stellatus SS14]|uniref:Uncharacterized protein n=1 Tax=Sphaerobolus stellatus (strain SS14) TaxID=990650 RepID=A0A0C9V3P1_SPHS4|nr:hypothetical protein M422DRAFT_31728 [Sphaerobolus stellatus SS14]